MKHVDTFGIMYKLYKFAFFDLDESVVFHEAFRARHRACFQKICPAGDCKVADEAIFGFARAMRDDGLESCVFGHADSLDCFKNSTDLIWLDKYRICRLHFNAFFDACGVGGIQIVSNDHHFSTYLLSKNGESIPVVFGKRIFYRNNGVFLYEIKIVIMQFLRRSFFTSMLESVYTIAVKLRRGDVKGAVAIIVFRKIVTCGFIRRKAR